MKTGTTEKVKFKRLQRRLSLPLWQATGLLEAIWKTAAQNAPDGAIGRLSNEDIAADIEWGGDANDLVAALIECGWLDEDSEFRLIIHDWSEHCSNYLKGNFAKHNKTFADIVAKQRPPELAKQHQNGTPTPTTKPSHTTPNQTTPTTPPSGGCSEGGGDGEDFNSVWEKAKPIAQRIRDALEPDQSKKLAKSDRTWAVKIAILACRHGPSWIDPAFEAMANTRNVTSPRGFMGKILQDECERLHTTLNRELASVKIPVKVF